MTEGIERPLVTILRVRLTAPAPSHPGFVGAPVDIADLQPLELGELWAEIRRAASDPDGPRSAKDAALSILVQVRDTGLVPALSGRAALAALQDVTPRQWGPALELFALLTQVPSPALAAEADRVLGDLSEANVTERHDIHGGLALALIAGRPSFDRLREALTPRASRSPYWRSELDVLPDLGLDAWLAMAGGWPNVQFFESQLPADPTPALAAEPAFVLHAEQVLKRAADRVGAIHRGDIPYQADGAFTPDDAQAIGRAMRVAALRDEPWLGPLIRQLLPEVCVAPTAARTLPSQAVAIALGHAIEAVPTPEAVEALKAALAVVRHAGVAKKLARNLKPAERGLAERPEVALRLTSGPKDKQRSAMLVTSVEAGLWQGLDLPIAVWHERLADAPGGRDLARSLIWVATRPDGAASALMLTGRDGVPTDAEEHPITLHDDARVSLWHPVTATVDERRRWQAAVVARRLRQPFRQAFREHYVLPIEQTDGDGDGDVAATSMFEGHVLSVRPLLGLARREGWRIARDQGLVRDFGAVRVTFAVTGRLFPGADGNTDSGAVMFERRDGPRWKRCAPASVEPIVFSEACRAIDLLVSTAGFALEDGPSDLPLTVDDLDAARRSGAPHPQIARWRRLEALSEHSLGEMAQARRDALAHVLADVIADGRVSMTARHLQVGDHAVHLATARVTVRGEPVVLDIPPAPAGRRLAAVPWLPYDEVLLQRIADIVGYLLLSRNG
ncbi:DUF4132 domain-containing protein [Roseateles chitinivorans]|uniref:DUF4132 domain-containing protein n=1 Tax=Roseateles chitinivorans TaxID=2917965 RepID=UPI003D670811